MIPSSTSTRVMLLAMVVGLAIAGFTLIEQSSILAPVSHETTSSISRDNGGLSAGPYPLTLYTVSKAEQKVQHTVVSPSNPSTVESGLQVIGVTTNVLPTTVTIDNGASSFAYSMVTVYLWNGTFVNGTTTYQDIMQRGGIAISESTVAANPRPNETLALQTLLNQNHYQTVTKTITTNGQVTQIETTITKNTNLWAYMSNINGKQVIVDPANHGVTWLDTTNYMWITINAPAMQTNQVLDLASSIIGTSSQAA